MAILHGKDAVLLIDPSTSTGLDSASYTEVTLAEDITVTQSSESDTRTPRGAGGTQIDIPGPREFTVSGTILWDPTDAQAQALEGLAASQETFALAVVDQTPGTDAGAFEMLATITNWTKNAPTGSGASVDFEAKPSPAGVVAADRPRYVTGFTNA